MTLRTVIHSDGTKTHWLVCDECKTASDPIYTGIEHEEGIAYAAPSSWLEIDELLKPGKRIRRSYCPRCAVTPEYRK